MEMAQTIAFNEAQTHIILNGSPHEIASLSQEEKLLVQNIATLQADMQKVMLNTELALQGTSVVLIESIKTRFRNQMANPQPVAQPTVVESEDRNGDE